MKAELSYQYNVKGLELSKYVSGDTLSTETKAQASIRGGMETFKPLHAHGRNGVTVSCPRGYKKESKKNIQNGLELGKHTITNTH
jgi:hypothetical protein